MVKGENACNQHFLLFLQCFLPFQRQISKFCVALILSSEKPFNLDQTKLLYSGTEIANCNFFMKNLTPFHTSLTLNNLEKEAFWTHCDKRRKSLGECNTILSAYTFYRHLGYYNCTHPSECWWPTISPLPTMFSVIPSTDFLFFFLTHWFVACKINAFNLDWCKILSFC